MDAAEHRLDGSIAYRALIRYDAYGEMSGRQSTSIALLDANRSGVVLSSIHHRDQARLYAKEVREGSPSSSSRPRRTRRSSARSGRTSSSAPASVRTDTGGRVAYATAAPDSKGRPIVEGTGGQMRVAYFGPEGTCTQEALLAATAGHELEAVPYATIYDTVMAVHFGAVQRALVPIENSLEGSVNATLDTLAMETEDVAILGEVVHPIRHCLIARTPLELSEIETVVSHPQATAQCARFIRTRLPGAQVLAGSSTADAVKTVAEHDGAWAALGNRVAAERYGCQCCGRASRTSPATRPGSCGSGRSGRRPAGSVHLTLSSGRGRPRSCSGASGRRPRAGSSIACRSSPLAT